MVCRWLKMCQSSKVYLQAVAGEQCKEGISLLTGCRWWTIWIRHLYLWVVHGYKMCQSSQISLCQSYKVSLMGGEQSKEESFTYML